MRIIIETIPHADQAYDTCGNYWNDETNGTLYIRVSKLSDWRHEALIAIHELIEALVVQANHVPFQLIDDFDRAFTGDGEPGDDPEAPYYTDHQLATGVERICAMAMGVAWLEYERAVDAL